MRRVHNLLILFTVALSYELIQEALKRNDGWRLWVALTVAVALPVLLAVYEIWRDVRTRPDGRADEISDAQVDAALDALSQDVELPYGARVENYLSVDSRGEERARQLLALRAADEEAEAKNRAVVRRVLQIAKDAGRG